MAGYAVLERVSSPPRRHVPLDWRVESTAVVVEDVATLSIEGDDTDTLVDRLERFRTALEQTTWYLFNTEGWR